MNWILLAQYKFHWQTFFVRDNEILQIKREISWSHETFANPQGPQITKLASLEDAETGVV
jgi:hypothetical protein